MEREKRRIYCPLARSNLSRPSLSLIQVCSATPSVPFVLVALREKIKRETERGKGQQKEEVRGEERVVEKEEEKEGTEGRLGKRVPTCTIRYNLCQQF